MWQKKHKYPGILLSLFLSAIAVAIFSPCVNATANINEQLFTRQMQDSSREADTSISIDVIGQSNLIVPTTLDSIAAQKQVISVATNSPTGYYVTLSSINDQQSLLNGGRTIGPVGGGYFRSDILANT